MKDFSHEMFFATIKACCGELVVIVKYFIVYTIPIIIITFKYFIFYCRSLP